MKTVFNLFKKEFCNYPAFPVGKYKNRYIKNVVISDINYCKWFLNNTSSHYEFKQLLIHEMNKTALAKKKKKSQYTYKTNKNIFDPDDEL